MRVLGCADENLDPETGVCTAEVWVEVPSWTDALPTRQQANEVGMAIFGACFVCYAMKKILSPPRDSD